MDFRGHLRLPKDAGTGIPVVLRVDDIYIVITSDGEEFGSWRADEMSVERIFSNQFALDLAGEPMVFLAADALGFAYEGVSAIEDLQARLTKRRVFKKKKAATKTIPEELDIPVEQPSDVVDQQPLWTPPASTPAATPGEDPAVVPADPREPVQQQRDRDEAPPTDSRVVYPSAKTVEPEPAPPLEPVAEFPVTAEPEPVVEPEPVAIVEPPVAPEPEHEAVPEPAAESPAIAEQEPPEVELEIEEVGLATSGGSWIEPESVSPEPEPHVESVPEVENRAAEELEIEDLEPAAAASVESFVAPAGEAPAPLSEEAEVAEVEETEVELQPDFVTEPEPVGDPVVEPVAEGEPLTEVPATGPEPLLDEPSETEPSEVNTLNGHREESSPKTAQRPSLFRRDKKPSPHDHVYGDPKTIGGLTRSVCDICGHVTFSGEDAYQGW